MPVIKAIFGAVSFVLLLPLQIHAQDGLICSSSGACIPPGTVGTFKLPITARATTCPASDCDGTGVLEHHLGDESLGDSVGCVTGDGQTTQANGFLRCFGSALCTTTRNVDSVSFRVQRLEGSNTFITLNLFKGGLSGCSTPLSVAGLYQQQPVVTQTVAVGAGFDFVVDVPLAQPITLAPTESLLVEIRAPSLAGTGQFFVADSRDSLPRQCDASYLQNTECGNNIPVVVSSFGEMFSSVSFIISVQTSPTLFQPTPVTFPAPALPTPTPPTPTGGVSEGCFSSFMGALLCVARYLFGWLFPF